MITVTRGQRPAPASVFEPPAWTNAAAGAGVGGTREARCGGTAGASAPGMEGSRRLICRGSRSERSPERRDVPRLLRRPVRRRRPDGGQPAPGAAPIGDRLRVPRLNSRPPTCRPTATVVRDSERRVAPAVASRPRDLRRRPPSPMCTGHDRSSVDTVGACTQWHSAGRGARGERWHQPCHAGLGPEHQSDHDKSDARQQAAAAERAKAWSWPARWRRWTLHPHREGEGEDVGFIPAARASQVDRVQQLVRELYG